MQCESSISVLHPYIHDIQYSNFSVFPFSIYFYLIVYYKYVPIIIKLIINLLFFCLFFISLRLLFFSPNQLKEVSLNSYLF